MANKVENMLAGVFVMRFIYRFMGYESGINGICMCNKSMEYGINRYDDIIYIYDMNLTIRYEMGASFLFWDLNGILLGHDYGIS